MDHYRSSTEEWMQRETAAGSGIWDIPVGENAENPSSGAVSPMSIDITWGSEGVDGGNAINAEAGIDDVELSMCH
jgi:hypothetical protein